jgi:hypothetical protein
VLVADYVENEIGGRRGGGGGKKELAAANANASQKERGNKYDEFQKIILEKPADVDICDADSSIVARARAAWSPGHRWSSLVRW